MWIVILLYNQKCFVCFSIYRFMPIGLEIKRIPQKDLVINGYQIPAGVITFIF